MTCLVVYLVRGMGIIKNTAHVWPSRDGAAEFAFDEGGCLFGGLPKRKEAGKLGSGNRDLRGFIFCHLSISRWVFYHK